MNLISDRWIPIRRADGTKEKIAPHEITRDISDKSRRIVAVASPRPDFDGALTQFLIGLLQTTCTPKTDSKWWDWRQLPPKPEQLEKIFKPYNSIFDLSGGNTGKLFMQERLAGSKKANAHPISYLLIGAPTDNALKTNTDHFQKRPTIDEYMCPPCAAAALYTLQTFAPSGGGGGNGKFTSLRGGGPLTTVLLGEYLWETIWLNVLVQGIFGQQPYDEKTFPWLKIDKFISKATPVKTIHSKSMNPAHVFWGMPRRIELDFCTLDEAHACSVCGSKEIYLCRGYLDCSGGLTYQEGKGNKKKSSWINPRHPLSPYYLGEDNRPSAVHPQPGGIGYRHWLGYVENATEGKLQRLPSQAIEQFRTMVHADGRLWASGYDMDNMKARCWYDATMPVLIVDTSTTADFYLTRDLNFFFLWDRYAM